jgi:phosphoribosylformylglycinamidine synthase
MLKTAVSSVLIRVHPWLMGSLEARRLTAKNDFSRQRRIMSPESPRRSMKAKIIITPKKAVLDPQGKTVQNALEHMGYKGVGAVHVGKYLEIELNRDDKDSARRELEDACHRFLSNPVIEDYKLEVE